MENNDMEMKCGEYNVTISFAEKENTEVMERIKSLIMSAYDLKKQRMAAL